MHRRSAFTLLEVLLAGSLLLVAVVPLVGFLDSVVRQTGLTRARIVARTLARSVTERYRVERLTELAARLPSADAGAQLIAADPILTLPAGSLTELAGALRMRRSAVLEPTADAREGLLRVRVDWEEDGNPRTYELKTLIVNDELATGALALVH